MRTRLPLHVAVEREHEVVVRYGRAEQFVCAGFLAIAALLFGAGIVAGHLFAIVLFGSLLGVSAFAARRIARPVFVVSDGVATREFAPGAGRYPSGQIARLVVRDNPLATINGRPQIEIVCIFQDGTERVATRTTARGRATALAAAGRLARRWNVPLAIDGAPRQSID